MTGNDRVQGMGCGQRLADSGQEKAGPGKLVAIRGERKNAGGGAGIFGRAANGMAQRAG